MTLRENATPDLDLAATSWIRPGTRLIRAWQGELHQVEVLCDGT